MLKRIRNLAVTTVALLVVGGGLAPTPARASLVIDVYINAVLVGSNPVADTPFSTTNTYAIGTISNAGTTFSDMTITATTNFSGTVTLGTLTNVAVSSTGSTGTGTLRVDVTETNGFLLPGVSGTTQTLKSNVSRSDGQTGTVLTYQSFSTDIASATVTPGLQTFDNSKGPTTFPNQASTTFIRGTTYTMSNRLTLTAGDVGNINVNGSSEVRAAPEPSSVVLVGIGALGMLGFGLRRRKAMGV